MCSHNKYSFSIHSFKEQTKLCFYKEKGNKLKIFLFTSMGVISEILEEHTSVYIFVAHAHVVNAPVIALRQGSN